MPAARLPRSAPPPRATAQRRAPAWWSTLCIGLLALLLGLARPAQAACGPVPTTYPITAGSAGPLNVNGVNTMNGLLFLIGLGNSINTLGWRVSGVPSSFPSVNDVSADPGTVTLTNLVIASGGTYTFSANTTFLINGGTIGNNVTVVVPSNTRIYIKGTVTTGTGLKFNTAGPTANGLFFLYPNANFSIGANSTFRGLIYGAGTGNNVTVGNGVTFTGAIVVNGAVNVNGGTYALSGSDQTALAAITTCNDRVKPTLFTLYTYCGLFYTADLVFSEVVDQTTAQTLSNYTLPGNTVTGATLGPDNQTVTLTFGSPVSTATTLSVKNVVDLAGNAIVAGSTIAVTPQPIYAGLYGEYYDQNGNKGSAYAFTGSVATRVDADISFNWGTAAPGVGNTPADGFSVSWSGVIKAPTTGTYGFATGTDDGVRLWVGESLLIDNWTDHSYTVNTAPTRVSATAGEYLPLRMDFYENTTDAVAQLGWQQPGQSGTTYYLIDKANLFNCTAPAHQLTGFTVMPASTSASTCSPQTVTITALDVDGATAYAAYTGTITLSTSSGRGTWALGSGPAPSGTLVNNGNGSATYTFVAADAGVVKLTLAHSLAQDVTVTVTGGGFTATSSVIQFRDNAFVFAEDLSAKVSGSDVAVAGRPHDMTLSLVKRDPSTGSCGVATDYTGSRALKLWRSDSGGSWTAPSIVSPALSVPAAQPAANNLTLSFSAGVASFDLGSTDIGRYSLNARDDSLSYAATAVTGASNTLTVRPFALLVQGLNSGSTTNPNGSAATDSVFTSAGSNFSATVGAYAWSSAMLSNGADTANTGTPAATATASALTAAGRTASFASAVTLAPLAASQTPAGGTLGTLNNGTVAAASFSGGQATVSNLQYTEVGSFALNTTGVVSNFLGSGLSLDAIVLNAAGNQNTRVGRFKPAGFVLSSPTVTHRSSASCSPSSSFTYLGEPFQLGFTLTARNALGATTSNYTGSFAKLDLATAANLGLAGVSGSTVFSTGSSPARLSLGTSSGTWANGVAAGVSVTATATRGTTADGPFDASFGIAPQDSDGVGMLSFDLDVDSAVAGNDHSTVGAVALRLGRLRLFNAIGAQSRALDMALAAQYWNGGDWVDQTADNCTRVPLGSVNFGNLRKTLTLADTNVANASAIVLSAGRGKLQLSAPGGGRNGTVDVALSLGSTATDASCLQPWTPGTGDAASTGADLAHLRGAWCGSSLDKDPSARASFGLFKGAETTLYLRENY